MNSQTLLKTTLLFIVMAMATACSQSKVDTGADFASRAVAPTASTAAGTPSAPGLLAKCNQKSQSGVTANLSAYYDSSNQIRYDLMKLKFLAVPAGFATGNYFEFFRWKVTASGQPSLDSTPVQARFEYLDGTPITDFSPTTSWAQVSQTAANAGIYDPTTFLRYVRLVIDLRDPHGEYDALKIASYNSSNQALTDMDELLPTFSASPKEYAADVQAPHPAILQALHPFANMAAASNEQYKAISDTYCF